MAGYVCTGVILLSVTCRSLADTNITLFSLPLNTSTWKFTLHDALNRSANSVVKLKGMLKGVLDFLKNGTIDCASQGEECILGVPSCCSIGVNNDTELQCLPEGDTYTCQAIDPEEPQPRIDALEYGDSMGALGSHQWAYSWEFQSRSTAEREEEQAAEEENWKKNWVPTQGENFWIKSYRKVKNKCHNILQDIRKLKKLKKVKDTLIENNKIKDTKNSVGEKEQEEKTHVSDISDKTKTNEVEEKQSEEDFIKFSDELPRKKEKAINFRIDNIIKDAAKLMDEKFKKRNGKKNKQWPKYKPPLISSPASEEHSFHLDEIEDTEDKLKQEINELKKLKKEQKEQVDNVKERSPDIEELIKKQVRLILEEERRLERLKKIEELKRLEEMKQNE